MLIKPTRHKRLAEAIWTSQRGISLMESLIALVVLALGIMGLAGVQTRFLAESRTANYRAVAIGLIDDLNNRLLLNRNAALSNPTPYALNWTDTATAAQDCVTNPCSGAQLAQSDLNQWRTAVAAALPGASAKIFLSPNDSRQIGIAIAWNANEGKAADTDTSKYNSPFSVTAAANGVACPANSICHFAYVQP
jgi:type IV pilus assembly protein PilV